MENDKWKMIRSLPLAVSVSCPLDIRFATVPESCQANSTINHRSNPKFSMSENESASTDTQAPAVSENEEITYQAVEKDGVVTAIWEMKGRKHLRTIDPRSRQGREILNLYTTEEEQPAVSEAATS